MQVFCTIWDARPADRKNLERVLRTWDAIFPPPILAAIRRRIGPPAAQDHTSAPVLPAKGILPPPAGLHPSLAAVAAVAAAGNRMYSVATRGATGVLPQ